MSIRTIFHYFLVLSPISGPRIQAIQRDAGIRRGAPTPSRGAPVSTPEVRPLPWREAGRTGVGGGGYPQAPTKEGCALSGLSRRTGNGEGLGAPPNPLPKRAGPSLDSPPEGRRSGQGLGASPKPPPKRAAPSLDSPAGQRPWTRGAEPRGRLTGRPNQNGAPQ